MFVVGTPSAPLPPILGCLAAMSLYLKMFIVEWRIECTSVHLVLSVVGYLQQSTSFFFGRFATLTVKGQHFSGGKKQWQIPSKNYSDLELSDYSALGLANVSLEIELLINSSPKSFFFFFFLSIFRISRTCTAYTITTWARKSSFTKRGFISIWKWFGFAASDNEQNRNKKKCRNKLFQCLCFVLRFSNSFYFNGLLLPFLSPQIEKRFQALQVAYFASISL